MFFSCLAGNKKINTNSFNKLHNDSLLFLEKEFKKKDAERTVVVTHHLPSNKCNSPEFEGSELNSAFCTDLSGFVEKSNADVWIYGHCHRNMPAFKIGKTLMLTNQLGYISHNEHKSFVVDRFIEV